MAMVSAPFESLLSFLTSTTSNSTTTAFTRRERTLGAILIVLSLLLLTSGVHISRLSVLLGSTSSSTNNDKNNNKKLLFNSKIDDDSGYFPIDSGEGNFWPSIPDEHWQGKKKNTVKLSRAFPKWIGDPDDDYGWCVQNRTMAKYLKIHKKQLVGLFYSKVHKAASSTMAGITLRIANNVGNRIGNKQRCIEREMHNDSRLYNNRTKGKSFMFTTIRHPVKRALSWEYYILSARNSTITENRILKDIQNRNYFINGNPGDLTARNMNDVGAQLGYLHTGLRLKQPLWDKSKDPNKVQNLQLTQRRVYEVIYEQYDFIGIVERLDESLVVMQLLLNLQSTDILYLSSKVSGGYAGEQEKDGKCYKLRKAPSLTLKIKNYLSSSTFYAQNYGDYLLYKAVNRSLDLTIDNVIGRDNFNIAYNKFKQMKHEAKSCNNEAIFPCSSNGIRNKITNCYRVDWGCGYPCLDRKFGTG